MDERAPDIRTRTELPCWYAVHTQPRQEDRADQNMKAWDIDTFLPRLRERRRKGGSSRRTSVFDSLTLLTAAPHSHLNRKKPSSSVNNIC